jgi:hypothetical protein
MYQTNLIFTKDTNLTCLRKLETVFSCIHIPAKTYFTGRPPYPLSAMVNALVFKNLRGLTSLSELTRELGCYPALSQAYGFDRFPSKERFSHFLKYTPNKVLKDIQESLIKELVESGTIKAKYLSTDFCPVKSPVKENNLKTNVKDRFNKNKIPKTDKEARLGAYIIYPTGNKKVQFFWGYRNHIINDAVSELPLVEITKPANIHESTLLISQLEYLKNTLKSTPEAVIADSGFDSAASIEYIVKKLKAKPVIAKNPRRSNSSVKFSRKGMPLCLAGFEMVSCGKFYDKEQNRMRHKFACPIKLRKSFAHKVGWFCPWNHSKFYSNRQGCTINLRIDVDTSIRQNIDYGSQTFKKLYALRTSFERIFSRLLIFSMQKSSVKGLQTTANLCSLAHISVLAVALAASKSNNKHKIRFIKPFLAI